MMPPVSVVYVIDNDKPVSAADRIRTMTRSLPRIEQEWQALALMDQPNIAKFVNADEAEGRPYFLIGLINAAPITEYCDQAPLSPRERLGRSCRSARRCSTANIRASFTAT
jgi:hypothetical protein